MEKSEDGPENHDASSSTCTEQGKPFMCRKPNLLLLTKRSNWTNFHSRTLLECHVAEGNGVRTSEMGIQADFTDEDSDLDSFTSEGDLVITDINEGTYDPSCSKRTQNVTENHSKSSKGEVAKNTRKAIELKYIYGDDLSKNDIERRKCNFGNLSFRTSINEFHW
jgi:hypothetical protein